MGASREDIEKALEWARNNNDESAVRGLSTMLENQNSALNALGPTKERAAALPEQTGALQESPWGERTQGLFDRVGGAIDEARANERGKAQKQYDADLTLMEDPANVPSEKEVSDWLWAKQQAKMPSIHGIQAQLPRDASWAAPEGKQVLRDPETGRLRWAAMSPEQLYDQDKESSPGRAITGAIGGQTVNLIGERIQSIEETEQAVEGMQRFVFSALSDEEKTRVRNDIARKYEVDPSEITDDVIATDIPPYMLKDIIDENDSNQSIYESIYNQESGLGERFKRAGSAALEHAGVGMSHLGQMATPEFLEPFVPGVSEEARQAARESNVFGAEDREGPILGTDTAAAHWLSEWEDRAAGGPESRTMNETAHMLLVAPFKAYDPDLQLGETIKLGSDKIKENAYGQYYERTQKPLLKPGTELTWEDLTNPETYTSDEAALTDPMAFTIKAFEQVPNMAPGLVGSYGGGKLAAKLFQGGIRTGGPRSLEMTIKELERLSRNRAVAGGLFGNAVGNAVVYDQAAGEVRDALNGVPDERLMEFPEIKALMATGLPFESAKQLVVQHSAGSAGRGAWIGSSIITAPSAGLVGMGGAGTLLRRNQGLRVGAALTISPLEEGFQEVEEGRETDYQIARVDPENPVLQDVGRWAERFFAGMAYSFATTAPIEGAAALEPSKPVGIDKATAEAARKTETYLEATNERFALEMKVTDQNYVDKTSGIRRLEQLEKLNTLQNKEADAILDMVGPVREYMKDNPVPGRDADLAMLDSLERFANSQKTDLAVAKNKRMTAQQMLEEHEAIFDERAELQRNVNERLVNLDDIKEMQHSLTLAQEQEPMTNEQMSEMIDNEYIVTVGDSNRAIITPKGRRALKNLGQQRLQLEQTLHAGFAGKERRSPESLARRDQIDRMDPDEKEKVLYRDPVTNTQNRRAFKERGQDAGAYASIQTDSLEWVNDNMNYAAGDRILSHISSSIERAARKVVAEGIKEIGDEEDLQLYRTSGNEFTLTGPNQDVIESVLQEAASDLAEQNVSDGRTDVTPSITWGKGDTDTQARRLAKAMEGERITTGKLADRMAAPVTAKGRTPDGSLQLDQDYQNLADLNVPRVWSDLDTYVEVGDIVEVLTPQAAQFGTVTRVIDHHKRPRIEVTIGDRRFRFNPERNWLINHPMSSPDDIAWITGDESFRNPDNIPQVMEEVQLGLMGDSTGNNWYADLATPLVTDQQTVGEWMSTQFSPNKQHLPSATDSQIERSEAVRADMFSGYDNLPDITLVHDINKFRSENGDLYNQILNEVKLSGGFSIRGVRGYFDHLHPEAGIYVFTANIGAGASMDGQGFEAAVQETIFHETVGHYGIRGVFKNEHALRRQMFELVDAFPDLAKRMEAQLNLYGATNKNNFDKARKQLLGEEMLAYVVGKQMSGQLDVTPKQRNLIQRILDWMKQWLNRFFGTYSDKFVSTADMQREFWNDDRVQELIVMSTDFARRGPPYRFEEIANGRGPQMRDGDIFQWNIQQILRTASRTLNKRERKDLANRYNGIENVPKELPIFPEEGSLNAYKTAVATVSKGGNPYGIKAIEMELLGLSDKSAWNLFTDLTYNELLDLHASSQNRKREDVDRYWYREYMPHDVKTELDAMFAALDKMSMVGPMTQVSTENDKFLLNYDDYKWKSDEKRVRRVRSEPSYMAMQNRIGELLDQKVDPKKTTINYDIFEAHINSSRAYRVYAEGNKGYPSLDREQAANMLFGKGDPYKGYWLSENGGWDSLTTEQQELVDETIRLTKTNGPDIGFNAETGEWMDMPDNYNGSWSNTTPVGGDANQDYRISLIKTKGGGYPDMPSDGQHFAANFMHIRQSVAEFLDAPSWAEYDAANQKYASKAMLLIELQTDWSTKHRKGFESEHERDRLDGQGRMLRDTLMHAHKQGMKMTDRLVADMTIQLIEPMLAFMPGYPSELREQAAHVTSAEAMARYNKPFIDLSVGEKQELWQLLYMKRNKEVQDKLRASEDLIEKYITETPANFRELGGSMDVRAFDALDQHAVNQYLGLVRMSLKNARLSVNAYDNPTLAVSNSAQIKGRLTEAIQTIPAEIGNQDEARLRIPFVKDKIKTVMNAALQPIGATDEQVGNVLQSFQEQDVASVTIQKAALDNLFDAGQYQKLQTAGWGRRTESKNKALSMGNRIFTKYWTETYSKTIDNDAAKAALADSPLLFSFDTGTDSDNLIVNVIGTPAAVAVFNEHSSKLLDEFVRKSVPKTIQTVAEQDRDSDTEASFWERQRDNWHSNNDLREYFDTEGGGEEFDVTDPSHGERMTLDENDVTHQETFREEYRDEAERNAYDSFTENVDWDEIGLNEEHDEYVRLVEENDGDTDDAEEWLSDERTSYEEEYRESDGFSESIDYELDSYWENRVDNDSMPYLYIAQMPVSWDENGEVDNTVEFMIKAENFGSQYYVYIDGDWKDSYHSEDDAWSDAPIDISNWMGEEKMKPPVGAFMGPTDQAEVDEVIEKPNTKIPNLDILSAQATDSIKARDQEKVDLVKGFRDLVTITKKFGGRTEDHRAQYYTNFYPDSPMHKDALWRTTALRYLLSDAVRRGFGAIVWHDGLASATRGGGGVGTGDRLRLSKIQWSKEIVEVGGKEQEVFVISSPNEMDHPIVVNASNMIQVLGVHTAGILRMQADGKWNPDETNSRKPIISLPFDAEALRNKENFIINEVISETTGRSAYSVHDVLENRFLGFYNSEAEAQAYIDSDDANIMTDRDITRFQRVVDRAQASTEKKSRQIEPTDPIGKRTSEGIIFAEDVGSQSLFLLPGRRVSGYDHTFSVPTLAGARMNYEKLTVDAWNKELKKYGAKIEMSYIKVDQDVYKAYDEEGQTGRSVRSEDQQWLDKYGDVEIVRVTEPNQGFVVMSEVMGPLNNTVFTTYKRAVNFIADEKSNMKGSREGSRVFTIVLNDKIKETFDKPVAPFHYDKRLDEHLKAAKSKFKDRKTSLADRFRKLRARVRGSFVHEFLDSYYGLKDALRVTGAPDRSYMAARLSTGLEARVKAALYYGHPVWKEDTTQSEGKGLMDILGGIGGDPQLWGKYMAGLRGKELMLEGYDNLSPEEQAEVDRSMEGVEGETIKDKIWNYLVARAKDEHVMYEQLYALTDADREQLGEAGSRFYEETLWHFRAKGPPPRNEDGSIDKRFQKKRLLDWEKKVTRNGRVQDMRVGGNAADVIGDQYVTGEVGAHDDPTMTMWERKKRNMVWSLMDDPRIKDDQGNKLHPGTGKKIPGRYRKWEPAQYYGVETVEEAERIIDLVQELGLEKQVTVDAQISGQHPVNQLVYMRGRESVFTPSQLVALVELGASYPSFDRVRKEFAEYNSKLLDFAQEAGVINSETRPIWESEFYVPLYRIRDDRIGGAMSTTAGITSLSKPIKRLHGGPPSDPIAKIVWTVERLGRWDTKAKKKDLQKAIDAGYIEIIPKPKKQNATMPVVTEKGREFVMQQGGNVGDILDNIMMNMVSLLDASAKNHAARMAVDDLKETGMIAKTPMATSTEMIPMSEVVKVLDAAGFNTEALPEGFKEGMQKMMAIQPPSGPGIIDILRDGKREYYKTDNMMLYESLTQVNRKNFGENWKWLTMPKRFYTGTITLSPAFMGANAFRDTISASISGRDEMLPFIDSMKGFVSAISDDEVMRTMVSGGAAFEAGFITGGDTRATRRMIEKAMAKADFQKTIANSPVKLAKVALMASWQGYTKLGSSLENASRVAIYKAARASGKSLLRSLYESKDIMDFSMRGNNQAIQTLVATVPFMGARIQGLYRTGRGFKDRPVASLIKGSLYMAAALAVWAQFREDERYKELQDWDKATYHHFWLGDNHIRLPRAFEVGALFTTIPEQWLEFMYSKEDDAGKQLIRQWAFMWGETFAMNPVPQTVKPIIEMMNNYNFFTDRQIVSPFDKRLAEDQFGPRTSETMRELAKVMPNIKIGQGNISSPKHLQNLYRGYTGTLGQYLLAVTDSLIRHSMDYPLPPSKTPAQNPLYGRFFLGSNPPPRTRYEEEFYRMIDKITAIQQSVSFYERTEIDDDRWDEILDTEAAYINVSDDLEDIREDVRELNREEMSIDFDPKMEPDRKRHLIDQIIYERNKLFQEAYDLRPGGKYNRDTPAETAALESLINDFGVNDSPMARKRLKEEAPSTVEIIDFVRNNMEERNLKLLERASTSR